MRGGDEDRRNGGDEDRRNGGVGLLTDDVALHAGDRAEQILRELEEQAKQRYVSPANRAAIHLGLGDKTKALDWLEKAGEDRDPIFWWNHDQLYDSVRNEPRFQALMQTVNRLKERAVP